VVGATLAGAVDEVVLEVRVVDELARDTLSSSLPPHATNATSAADSTRAAEVRRIE
jgi:hypothetical protein